MALATVGVSAARQVEQGREHELAAEAALARADWPEAIRHAREAAEARAPGSPWPDRGDRTLRAIAASAENRGDSATAALAAGALRTAAFATRSAPEGPFVDARVERLPSVGVLAILNASVLLVLLGLAFMAHARAGEPPRTAARIASFAVAAGIVAYAAVLLMH